MDDPGTATPTLIQSLQRGLRLVEVVTEHGPMTAKDLSGSAGLVLPTTYHLLRTLVHEGYMQRVENGLYALGPQLTSVAQFESRARSLRLVREEMLELAASARVSVSIGVLCDDVIRVSQFTAHPRAPRFACWPGMPLPGHATAIGKNILARMSSDARHQYLSKNPMASLTSKTPVTLWRLEQELTPGPMTRCDEQYQYGLCCVSKSLNQEGALAAVGAAYDSTRALRIRKRTEDLVARAAIRISDALAIACSHPPEVQQPRSDECCRI